VEIIQLIEVTTNELNKVKELVEWAFKELEIPSNDAIVYITDNHNRIREALGLESATHEEWPVKYMNTDELTIISIIPSKLLQLKEDEARIMVLREVALIKVMNDPTLIDPWSIPQSMSGDVAYRISLAMLRRTVDVVIAKYEALIQYLINAFNMNELRNALITCKPTIDCAITALTLDIPLSIELAGNMGLGRSLWNDAIKGIDNDFIRKYDDFRDFVRNNFNIESAYNYLLMMFRKS